uniref:Protein HGV2-like isoform X2 n=1 Tax=Dermatophagoides pteronyssinus TaxID=6956 RepID=A0A6P6XZK6_DERPT|nr:protein HGV2-like isoform X2 [Dermatophagoides pteronyssinus]
MADPSTNKTTSTTTTTTNKNDIVESSTSNVEMKQSSSSSSSLSKNQKDDEASSSMIEPDKELLAEALQSMQHGKRHMIVSDYRSAVPCFETACEFLGHLYGLRALECAEAYLNYGIALYELSRLEEGLDGGIVNVESNGGDDDDDDDDDDNDEKDGDDDEQEDENAAAGDEKEKTKDDEQGDDDEKQMDIDLMAQQKPSTSKASSAIDVPGTSSATNGGNKNVDGEEEEEEEEDNASNIEIAYEVLTTAKDIYSQHLDNSEITLNYAEALQKLGEISIDWENPDGAIGLLNECLEQRRRVLPADDRLVAVTYHYLGLAYSFKLVHSNDMPTTYECETSNNCFQSALDVIKLRIDNLKNKDTSKMDTFEKATLESEIQQLESLMPEIQLKIEDMKEQIQSGRNIMDRLEMVDKKEREKTEEFSKLPEKPITNITHLIKRKRDDIDGNNTTTTTSNGNNKENGTSNCSNSNNDVPSKKLCSSSSSSSTNNDNVANTSLVSSTTTESSSTAATATELTSPKNGDNN